MSRAGRRATGALSQPDDPWCLTPHWTDVNDGPGIPVPYDPLRERWREEPSSPPEDRAASGESRGAETSRVLTSIMNDGDQSDEIRGLAMFRREERAAGIEASDVGPAKRRTRPGRARRWILLTLLVPFTILTHLAVRSGSPGDVRERPVLLTTLATITGPFTGAIARHGQSCCLDSSLRLARFCGPALALGILAQLVPVPFARGRGAMRLAAWTAGWLAWLLAGPASLLHALS
jgi:hypothetical protein